MSNEGSMSHEAFLEMEKACDLEDGMTETAEKQQVGTTPKNEFNPDYPATIDDAIEMIEGMFEERAEENDELTKGYKAGLQMGLYVLGTLKRLSGG